MSLLDVVSGLAFYVRPLVCVQTLCTVCSFNNNSYYFPLPDLTIEHMYIIILDILEYFGIEQE